MSELKTKKTILVLSFKEVTRLYSNLKTVITTFNEYNKKKLENTAEISIVVEEIDKEK